MTRRTNVPVLGTPPCILGRVSKHGQKRLLGMNSRGVEESLKACPGYGEVLEYGELTDAEVYDTLQIIARCGIPAVKELCRLEVRGGLWTTRNVEPHIDGATGDYTLGYVCAGNHQLWAKKTYRGRVSKKLHKVGILQAGDVFLINNKKEHSVEPMQEDSDNLVFLGLDFDMLESGG